MEVSWQNFFSDMEMEDDDLFNQCHKKSLDDEELILREILEQSALSSESEGLSSPSNGGSCLSFDHNNNNNNNKRGKGKLVTKSNSSKSIDSQHAPHKPPSYVLSFEESTISAVANGRKHQASKGANLTARKGRSLSESLEHIMVERKRRLELTERFIALSATIPGLKKIDKASILSEAITYVTQLQKRLKELEEQSCCKKIKVESVSFVKKADLYSDEGSASCCKTNSDDSHGVNAALPEVEARVLEKEVLIRIHCKKQNGFMLKILTHLKSLDLSTVSNSVLPFGNSVLGITIIAQMGDKYNLTVKDLVKSLKLALCESRDVQQ